MKKILNYIISFFKPSIKRVIPAKMVYISKKPEPGEYEMKYDKDTGNLMITKKNEPNRRT